MHLNLQLHFFSPPMPDAEYPIPLAVLNTKLSGNHNIKVGIRNVVGKYFDWGNPAIEQTLRAQGDGKFLHC